MKGKIAPQARLTVRGAQKCLRQLESAGLISAEGRRAKSTVYRLHVPDDFYPGDEPPFTPKAAKGRTPVHPGDELGDTNGRTPVHPNREEPSIEPEGDSLNKYDEGIIWS